MKPDTAYLDREDNSYRRSWSTGPDLSEVQTAIFEYTEAIPGWQMRGDTYKLLEMAYHCGEVILEIGMYSGRSATVELRGALMNQGRKVQPQYYGVDIDPEALLRTHQILKGCKLDQYAAMFCGNVEQFAESIDIAPTMVFLDGDHSYEWVKRDLAVLGTICPPGTPVLCHDYRHSLHETGEYGVQPACDEWEQDGYATWHGLFGCSALLVTTDKTGRFPGALPTTKFDKLRSALLRTYRVEEEIARRTR